MTTGLDWAPVSACTLPTAEQPLRVAEFDALFAAHLTRVRRVDRTRALLVLAGDHDVTEKVQDLANRETGCCSFFTFTITDGDEGSEGVLMEIVVPAAHAAVLEALVARAEAARDQARA